ncbi:MAG: ABC transporter permease, partial [Actinomycetes bacterium]
RTWIGNLARRELTAKHKRSLLGWAWSLINPAATLGIYSLVFGIFLRIPPPTAGNGHTKSFALYLFVALMLWNFFNAIVVGSMTSLDAAGSMLSKVYFPPESPAISNLIASLVQVAIETSIALVILAAVGNVGWTMLFIVPIVCMLAVFSLGVGLFVSVYNIMYRDVNYLVGIFMQMLFYATPIVYPLSLVEEHGGPLAFIIERLNPLTAFVQSARDALYLLKAPPGSLWVSMAVWSVVSLAVGWWAFNRRAADLIEKI